jgi:hypothetical protein
MQSVSWLPRGATGGRTAAAAPADFAAILRHLVQKQISGANFL